jgi:hypothetical protein
MSDPPDAPNVRKLYVAKLGLADHNLITSRKTADLPVFCAALVGALQAARPSF